MAGLGFQIYHRSAAGSDTPEPIKSKSATQYAIGDALTVMPASGNKGEANQVAAADKATHIYVSMKTPDHLSQPAIENKSTTLCETILAIPVKGGRNILKTWLVGDSAPPIANKACNSNSTTTEVKITEATSDNDYDGGTLYCHTTGEQFLITDSQDTAGVCTFTISPPAKRALTTGDTISAVPFCKGTNAVKFQSTDPQTGIGTAVGDKTGGHLQIEDVNLKGDNIGPYVLVSCPDGE